MGLPAPGGVEDGAVERHPAPVGIDVDHHGVDIPQVGVTQEQQIGLHDRNYRGRPDTFAADPTVLGDHESRRHTTAVGTVSRRRSEEHTSELQSLMRISYAVFCLKKK